MGKVPALVLGILSLVRPKSWGPFVETFNKTSFDHAFTVSWSQGGEDLALLHLIESNSIGRYIDVGAHHPSRFSITRHLYQQGWRGINIDANPKTARAFKGERPEDVFINACVGTAKEYTFHIFDEPALSTSNNSWREKLVTENQTVNSSLIIEGISLETIIHKYFEYAPDLLIVDAEGSDFDVLQSCNWKQLPKKLWPTWIVCETTPPLNVVLETPQINLLTGLGYNIYAVLPMSTILKLERFRKEEVGSR